MRLGRGWSQLRSSSLGCHHGCWITGGHSSTVARKRPLAAAAAEQEGDSLRAGCGTSRPRCVLCVPCPPSIDARPVVRQLICDTSTHEARRHDRATSDDPVKPSIRRLRRRASSSLVRAPGRRYRPDGGTVSKIAGKVGVGLPTDDGARPGMLSTDSWSCPGARRTARQLACKNLCTCHVRADDGRVWARLLELVEDPDPRVRRDVIHALTDGAPSLRVSAVIQALESRRNDPDERIRRRVRKTLAHYRRTGKVTDAAR